MIVYLIKVILCSAVFIICYILLLEKEKIHRFKRFYLLASIVLAFIIPAITLEINQPTNTPDSYLSELLLISPIINSQPKALSTSKAEINPPELNWPIVLVYTYAVVTTFLLFRLLYSFLMLLSSVSGKNITSYGDAKIVINDLVPIPFTFLNYIFMNTNDAKNQQILMHELTHVHQKHTLDILFIEIIQCLMWFNPCIIFYKKSIQLNHEFLADEKVIKNHPAHEYQSLLLRKSQPGVLNTLTSGLNYSLTKKRFIMMSTVKNHTRSMIKISLSVISICCTAIIFPQRAYAQPSVQDAVIVHDTIKLQSDSLEFDILVEEQKRVRFKKTGESYICYDFSELTEKKRKRMIELYEQLSEEQKSVNYRKVYAIFLYPPAPPIKQSPSYEQLTTWTDQKKYGVWLDGKRISNDELQKCKPSDISHYYVSKLLKNAYIPGKHTHQVDLYTNTYYKKNIHENPIDRSAT